MKDKLSLQFEGYQHAIETVNRLKKRSYLGNAEQREFDHADQQVRFLASRLGELADPDAFEAWRTEPQEDAGTRCKRKLTVV